MREGVGVRLPSSLRRYVFFEPVPTGGGLQER